MAITDFGPTKQPSNGAAIPPQPTEQEKSKGGRPTNAQRAQANHRPVSTERLIETKQELESILAAAGSDEELIQKIIDCQLLVSDVERILINRRKAPAS